MNMSLNWFIPAPVNSRVGSLAGTSESDGHPLVAPVLEELLEVALSESRLRSTDFMAAQNVRHTGWRPQVANLILAAHRRAAPESGHFGARTPARPLPPASPPTRTLRTSPRTCRRMRTSDARLPFPQPLLRLCRQPPSSRPCRQSLRCPRILRQTMLHQGPHPPWSHRARLKILARIFARRYPGSP